jgi:hypothetical protein
MWFECMQPGCKFASNSPSGAAAHEAATGHFVVVEMDWTDNEEEVF